MKKTACILLSLMLTLTGLIGLCVTANAAYSVGDIIEYGNYPQSKVTNSALKSYLTTAAGSVSAWNSYDYYSGTGNQTDGKMSAKDFMRYKDVIYNGEKYRGVYFSAYRPFSTGLTCSLSNTRQYENGYYTETIYWFKYEPIKWRVLDPAAGMIMTESDIDAQAFNNFVQKYGEVYFNEVYYKYASDWSMSSLRAWLNDDFLGTAFSDAQKANIKTTHLTTFSTSEIEYNSNPTDDKVYLLSYDDVINPAYGFSANNTEKDTARKAKGTDYAKCQGLYISSADGSKDCSYWYLRSPYQSLDASAVNPNGTVYASFSVYGTSYGIRPVCNLSVLKSDTAQIGSVTAVSVSDSKINYKASAELNPQITADTGAQCIVQYASSDPQIVTVDENGNLYGAKKGEADITVTVTDTLYGSTFTETCTVTVKYAWWQWLIIILLFGWIWY